MFPLILYFSILLAIIIAVWRTPSIAIAAILCMYGLEQWAQSVHPFFSTYHSLTNLAIGGILVLALAMLLLKNKPVLSHYPRTGWLTLLLLMYTLISIIWSPIPELGYTAWGKQWPYLITIILLSPLLITSTEGLRTGFMALLPLGTILILLLLLHSNWTVRGVELVIEGGQTVRGNPLAVAQMAGYVMLCVVLLNFHGSSRIWQYGRWLIVAACMALAVKAGARGQFFSMLIVSLAFLPFSRRIVKPGQFFVVFAGMLALAGIGFWALDYFMPTDVTATRWGSTGLENDLSSRLEDAFRLLDHWSRSPLTLLFGLGNTASYDPRIIGFYSHIVPLEILGEEGLIGFGLFASIIIMTIRSLIRTRRLIVDEAEGRGTLAALGAMFVFELVLSLKQGSMVGSPFLFAFIIMIGKYEELMRYKFQQSSTRSSPKRNTSLIYTKAKSSTHMTNSGIKPASTL